MLIRLASSAQKGNTGLLRTHTGSKTSSPTNERRNVLIPSRAHSLVSHGQTTTLLSLRWVAPNVRLYNSNTSDHILTSPKALHDAIVVGDVFVRMKEPDMYHTTTRTQKTKSQTPNNSCSTRRHFLAWMKQFPLSHVKKEHRRQAEGTSGEVAC